MAKRGSEKLKCNDLFFFYSILPPKKWGKTIESLLTFSKICLFVDGLYIGEAMTSERQIVVLSKSELYQYSNDICGLESSSKCLTLA